MTLTRLRRSFLEYGVAVAAVGAALAARALLNPALDHRLPFITMYGAVAIAIWFGGWGPALVAALLGYAGAYWTIVRTEPASPLALPGTGGLVGFVVYVISAFVVIGMGSGMRAARRRAEAAVEAARATEAELLLVTSRTPVLLTRCGADRRYAFVNRAAAEFLGRPPSEIIGRTISEVIGETADHSISPHIDRVLAGETVEFETEIPYAHPGPRFMHVTYTPDRDARGEVVGWFASLVDVTMQKQAERALGESEQRFSAMADAAPVLMWISDTDKLCTWFNRPWLDFVGRTMEQEIGNGWADNVHADDFDRCLKTFVESFDARRSFSMEYRLRRHDGEYRWLLDRGVPRYDPEGRFVGYIGSCIDIADLKLTQEALVEADRRKDEFLATLAHELRNPLAPIRSEVEILRLKGPLTPELKRSREVIDRQTHQMTRLIDDLMDVSRITRDRLELRKQRIDLRTVLQAAVEMSHSAIEGSRHDLVVRLPDEPISLDADVTRLAQVFSNLLSNAAKFSEAGSRIVLAATREGADAVISVRDTGIGIPADMLTRIFEPFVQVDRSLERAQSGLGIGLTLVKRLLEMHAGTVEARSDGPGKGSEFVVRLPAATTETAQVVPLAAPEVRIASQKNRVLVADDNIDAATSLSMVLEILGYETRMAHDGVEALKAATEFRPDVALLDIGMPQINGYDVARHIRKQPWGQRMLLMAVTGWGQAEDKQRTLDAGFDHHLVKPVDPDRVAQLLASKIPEN